MKDMRKYGRFSLRLRGRMQVPSSGSGEGLDVVTSDISAGGAFLHTTKPPPKGTWVKLRLIVASKRLKQLTGAQGSIKVSGTVVRSSPEGMALCFFGEHEFVSVAVS